MANVRTILWDGEDSFNGVPVETLRKAYLEENGTWERVLVYFDDEETPRLAEWTTKTPEEWRVYHQALSDAADAAAVMEAHRKSEDEAKAEEDRQIARDTLAALQAMNALLAENTQAVTELRAFQAAAQKQQSA